MTYAELEAKPRPEHALPCCCLGCRSTLERCSEALPSRQAPNFQVSPEKAPPPSPCRIILEVAVRPPRALWPHMSSPTPFPPSWPTRSQPSRGLIGGAAHPRTPPFHAARRLPPSRDLLEDSSNLCPPPPPGFPAAPTPTTGPGASGLPSGGLHEAAWAWLAGSAEASRDSPPRWDCGSP